MGASARTASKPGKLFTRAVGDRPTSTKQVNFLDIADGAELLRLVNAALEEGTAVMFGRTSDGGAVVIKFFSGDEKTTVYVPHKDDWSALMAQILA